MGKEQNAEWYDDFYRNSPVHGMRPEDFDFYSIWQAAAKWIHRSLNASSVRDLGCGPGYFAAALFHTGWRGNFLGEDFSQVAITQAIRRDPILGDFRLCDIRRKSVIFADVVTAFEVLEHVEDDFGVLSRLRPDTQICFSVPNTDHAAHVRYFKSSAEVVERYARYIEISNIEKFELEPGELFWLVRGSINSNTQSPAPLLADGVSFGRNR